MKKIFSIITVLSIMLSVIPKAFAEDFNPFDGDDEINVVYIGGSITAGAGASAVEKRWVSIVGENLKAKFGDGKVFNNYNAGIGGTGSDLGLMRIESDVISKKPDMVFIEFAVNDFGSEKGLSQMESIVKTLQTMEPTPYIMFVFTTTKALTGTDYQKYHRQVADYYGIPYVDLDAAAKRDGKDLDKILGDGVHPNDEGYVYYADVISKDLEKPESFVRPEKKEKMLSEKSKAVCVKDVSVKAFDISGESGVDYELTTNRLYLYTDKAKVCVKYTGDIFAVRDYIWDKGGKYSIRADGMEKYERDTYYKNSASGVLNMGYLDMDMTFGEHTVEIQKTADDNTTVVLGYMQCNTMDDNGVVVKQPELNDPDAPAVMKDSYDEAVGTSVTPEKLTGSEYALINAYSNQGGKIIVRIGSPDGEVIAETEIKPTGNMFIPVFTALYTGDKEIKDNTDIFVTVENAEWEYVDFIKPDLYSETLDVMKIDALNLLTVENAHLQNANLPDSWAAWAAVDFGEGGKMLDCVVEYAVTESYEGSALELRLDAPDGELIGYAILKATGGWNEEQKGSVEFPVLKAISDLHTIYARIEDAPTTKRNKAGNIITIKFSDAEENSNICCMELFESFETVALSKVDNPILITAVYDNNGYMTDAFIGEKETSENITICKTNIPHSENIGYVNSYVWDGINFIK